MTKELIEQERRFTILEEQGKQNITDHKAILVELKALSNKLDNAIECKADQKDVDYINSKLWGFVSAVVVAFIGLIVWLIQKGGA